MEDRGRNCNLDHLSSSRTTLKLISMPTVASEYPLPLSSPPIPLHSSVEFWIVADSLIRQALLLTPFPLTKKVRGST